MITTNSRTRKTTFSLEIPDASKVFLVGEFNNWSQKKNPMRKLKGMWQISLPLKPGEYKFKYLADSTWQNDPVAHKYCTSPFGGDDSVVVVPDYPVIKR